MDRRLAASDGGGHVHLLKWPSLGVDRQDRGQSRKRLGVLPLLTTDKNLLVGSSDRNLYRCEAKPDAKAESIAKGTDWITQLAVSPDGQVAAGEVGGRLHFPSTGGTDSMDAASGVWALCWNGDGQLVRRDSQGRNRFGRSIVEVDRGKATCKTARGRAQSRRTKAEAKEEMKEEAKAEQADKPKAEKPKAEDKPQAAEPQQPDQKEG